MLNLHFSTIDKDTNHCKHPCIHLQCASRYIYTYHTCKIGWLESVTPIEAYLLNHAKI